MVILPPGEVPDESFQGTGFFTSSWSNPWAGTFKNTAQGSVLLASKSWWEDTVYNGTKNQRHPSLAIDSNNVVHIAWGGNNDGDEDIYYANSTNYYTSGTFLSNYTDTGYSPANFTQLSWANSTPLAPHSR